MGTTDARTFSAPYQQTFDAVVQTLPLSKFTVNAADPANGTIQASSGLSMGSWGETISLRVGAVDAATTTVTVESGAKFGMTYGKNKRNVAKILDALSAALPTTPSAPQGPG